MPCVNLDNMRYLVTYDPSNPQNHLIDSSTAIGARGKTKIKYWYCQFSCHNSFRIFDIKDLLTAEEFQQVKNKELFLVLDNGLEPFLKSADSIYYNIVIKHNIPADQIIFMSSVPSMVDYVKTLSSRLNLPMIRVEWWSMFEYQLWDVLHNQIKKPLDTLQVKKYKKKFINFNRRWRLHRPLMITLLHDRELLEEGFVSFGTSDLPQDNWESRWREMNYYYNNSPELIEIFNKNIDVKNLPPMYLDTTDLVTNRAEQTRSTDQYYLNSYFSIVNETTYHTKPGYDGVPFLSEKIFKTIVMKHPFVMVSVPNSLQYLKALGYKTFDSIINEDYDLELDDGKRILKILDEIERLCNLTESELKDFLEKAKSICDYNYDVLKNKKIFIKQMN